MKIYLAHPISGLSYGEVMRYYVHTTHALRRVGYDVLCPMTGKDALRNETKLRAHGVTRVPLATNHAIIERDRWMVTLADVVYCNLMSAEYVSIGCCMELAWAHDKGRHTIIALPESGVHEHAFVLEAADIVWRSHDDAMKYLHRLIVGVR